MDNKSCTNNKHQYGLWNINKEKNIVFRYCEKCKYKLKLPTTEETVMEIVKQDEAKRIFEAFQLVPNTDENIINYLELILEEYINYLDKTDYNSLVKRIKILERENILDPKNILYLNKMNICLEIDNEEKNSNNIIEIIDETELAYEQS